MDVIHDSSRTISIMGEYIENIQLIAVQKIPRMRMSDGKVRSLVIRLQCQLRRTATLYIV